MYSSEPRHRSIFPLLLLAASATACDRSSTPTANATSAPQGAAAPGSASPATTAVRFGEPKPAVGDAYTTTLRMEAASVHTHAELPGIEQKSGMRFEVVAATEVLAVSDGRETKWKLTFERGQMKGGADGAEAPLPFAGKTVLAERKGDEIVTTDADGKPLDEEIGTFAGPLLSSFDGWRLPPRALTEGDEVPELAAGTGAELTRATRFLKREGEIGWFERVVEMKAGAVSMTMTCRAGIRVADGRAVSSVCQASGASGPGASGGMRTTTTRQRKGEAAPPLPTLDAPPAKASGEKADAFDAVCYGETELTTEQRYFLQQQYDDGNDRCPGWSAATLTIAGDAVELNGLALVAKESLPKPSELTELSALTPRLRLFGERWRSFHPNKPFPGKVTIEAPKDADTATVLSVAATAVRAGFPNLTLAVGGSPLHFGYFLPAPAQVEPPPRVLHVEPLAAGGLRVGVLSGTQKLEHEAKLAKADDLADWVGARCATEPCFGRVALRPLAGPIEETVAPLRTLLSAKSFAEKPPRVTFTFGCAVAAPTREDAVKGPWGPRTPEAPCF